MKGVEWNWNERAEDIEEDQQNECWDNPQHSRSSQDRANPTNSKNDQVPFHMSHFSMCTQELQSTSIMEPLT